MTESAARGWRRFLCWLGWHDLICDFEKKGFSTIIIDGKTGEQRIEYSEHAVPFDVCKRCGKRK